MSVQCGLSGYHVVTYMGLSLKLGNFLPVNVAGGEMHKLYILLHNFAPNEDIAILFATACTQDLSAHNDVLFMYFIIICFVDRLMSTPKIGKKQQHQCMHL